MERTNTRFKHQSEQFWVAEKTTKGGGALKRPAPLCSFLGSQNSSNCCLSLVFVGFNLLILCWLAGANDEVHSFKFNSYFLTFETLGIFNEVLYYIIYSVTYLGMILYFKSLFLVVVSGV